MSDTTTSELAQEPVTVAETEQVTDTPAAETATPEPSEGEENKDVTADRGEKEQPKELTEADKIKYAMQKRIDRMTARDAQRERELAELREQIAKVQPKTEQSGEPKEDQFNTIEDYLIAKGRYEERQEIAKERAEAEQRQKAEEYQKTILEKQQVFEAKEAEFRKEVPDYDDKVGAVNEFLRYADPKSIQVQAFRDFVMDSDNPAAVLYNLGVNPDLMDDLAKMHPVKMIRELTKLEIQAASAPKKEPKATATPPSPIKGNANYKSEDQMTGKELLKKHNLR